ncbi:hypothetical protein NP233_g5479 [Leucocoprinus birnbaumii]|uniref:Uncharacterized protein n=1 Tax=Leucocoprinus birnbaumii TaxID=56174 RepID=A0AAD5VV62_9AGAR|nr:hypothetical protein NP233_g5479 [Leucocoprinus birnbaumii]
MPSLCDNYDVLLEFTNDTQDPATIQLLRDYGRSSSSVVLLNVSESVTLVLESGSSYRYAVKVRTRVVSITARAWRNVRCQLSNILSSSVSTPGDNSPPDNGVRVDGLFRDFRTSIWNVGWSANCIPSDLSTKAR